MSRRRKRGDLFATIANVFRPLQIDIERLIESGSSDVIPNESDLRIPGDELMQTILDRCDRLKRELGYLSDNDRFLATMRVLSVPSFEETELKQFREYMASSTTFACDLGCDYDDGCAERCTWSFPGDLELVHGHWRGNNTSIELASADGANIVDAFSGRRFECEPTNAFGVFFLSYGYRTRKWSCSVSRLVQLRTVAQIPRQISDRLLLHGIVALFERMTNHNPFEGIDPVLDARLRRELEYDELSAEVADLFSNSLPTDLTNLILTFLDYYIE